MISSKFRTRLVLILALIIVLAGGFCIYWIKYLDYAHSTFENYYHFRGCVQLVERTDTFATCKLANGQTIKIVLYQGRWFLDGDLPTYFINW